MDRFGRWFGRSLVVVLGLISAPVLAQSGVVFNDQAAAMAACQAYRAAWVARNPTSDPICIPTNRTDCGIRTANNGRRLGLGIGRLASSGVCAAISTPSPPPPYTGNNSGDGIYFDWLEVPVNDCASKPELIGFKAPTASGTGTACHQGCSYSIAISAPPGPLYSGLPTGQLCPPGEPETLPEESDPNTKPPCPDGSLTCPGTQEPTDPDAPEDTGGGGFTCDTPPVCKSDGVTCSMLYQTWRGRCDAQASNLSNSEALEGIGEGLGEIGDGVNRIGDGIDSLNDAVGEGNGILEGISDFLEGMADALFGDGSIDEDGPIGDLPGGRNVSVDSEALDSGGLGLPRSCPAILTDPISFGFFGNTYELRFAMFCDLLDLVGQILVVLAAFVGVRILLKSVQ